MPHCIIRRFDYRCRSMVPCTRYQWEAIQQTAEANGWTPFPEPDQQYQTRPFIVMSPLFPHTILTHELGAFVFRAGFLVVSTAPEHCTLTCGPSAHPLVSDLTPSNMYFVFWFMTPDSEVLDPPEPTVLVFSIAGPNPSLVTSYVPPHHGQGSGLQFTIPEQSSPPDPPATWIEGFVTQFALSNESPPKI
jgi:hypothetical protein